MTIAFTARNPNDAFPQTVDMLTRGGVLLSSRNGPCLEYPEPVSVTFIRPLERVLTHPARRINPFLHYFEPFWILAGQRDVYFPAQLAANMANYSDDGKTFAAAYGARLRYSKVSEGWEGGSDQIRGAIDRLRKDPDDRRTVLQIRTPEEMWYEGKDCACNIAAALKVRGGTLNIHVFNRSNDAVWGGPAGGTNHPQFTTLLEYIAGHVGCQVGEYTVTTDSMHAYVNPQWEKIKDAGRVQDPYKYFPRRHAPYPMMEEPALFDEDLDDFFHRTGGNKWIPNQVYPGDYSSVYFKEVFIPMWRTFLSYKNKDGREREELSRVKALDWQDAVSMWFDGIERLQKVPT